ncbi:XRE family transcriptional regulator [Streptococcus dysgalactiae]|uniref:Phage repressor protein C with HTH and peptisase S24 domain n=2 Tax=Streptococcus TaxID=1301 RepID=A0ABU0A7T2_STRDY|nr:LexA family transcriptional regulator [Streptococcus dysgalactiae]EGL46903.1 DNA-binding helix-turn-helix protein [Streptococcus dysgalactiae subsp. equisimilis SK1249]MDQ0262189.1 phage repressor protein C with HTH and peptisase S24 domain [Streptococcus dysgalactiae]QQC54676.1 helix-turn-helix domain-containing protein [Streptococcus dysgalactiae]SUN71388.1 HTH-type transcriptional regulator rdgA [Streptococcus dysgalactiae]
MFSGLRLKQRRENQNLSQVEIANILEINRSSYSSWESGRAKPNQKNLTALATLLEVPVTYFESEYNIVNNYLQLSPNNQVKAEEYVEELLLSEQTSNVTPLFSVQVLADVQLSAGLGEGFFDEFETETVYSDEEQYGYDIAAWIEGDSMEPVYKSGEVALIRSNGFDYDGAVYALSWKDSVYIKKLYRDEDGFRMVSLNKDYPEKFIPYEDEPRIVGLVVGHFMPVEGV